MNSLSLASESLTPRSLLQESLEIKATLERRRNRNKLATYQPSTKQLEFHTAGVEHRERLFMTGNQLGKTLAGGMEFAMHLTGKYPEWWDGRVVERPPKFWAAGVTAESTRDNPQRILLGPPQKREDWGTGTIPGDAISDISTSCVIDNGVNSVVVVHESGGSSIVVFKNYTQGRQKWQGETLDGVWFDEEPPLPIYTEGLTRTNETGGFTMVTFTPLLGMSDVVRMFLKPDQVKEMVG